MRTSSWAADLRGRIADTGSRDRRGQGRRRGTSPARSKLGEKQGEAELDESLFQQRARGAAKPAEVRQAPTLRYETFRYGVELQVASKRDEPSKASCSS